MIIIEHLTIRVQFDVIVLHIYNLLIRELRRTEIIPIVMECGERKPINSRNELRSKHRGLKFVIRTFGHNVI